MNGVSLCAPISTDSTRRKRGNPATLQPKPWKPGQSGNLSGRPKRFITMLSQACRERLKQVGPNGVQTFAELIAERIVDEAAFGKYPVQAFSELIDRTEGKPLQTMKLEASVSMDAGKRRERIAELVARITAPAEDRT